MAEELPCHSVLEDGGHSLVVETQLALGVRGRVGHGAKKHPGVGSEPATRFDGERDKLRMVVFVALGDSRPAAGETVASGVSRDLTLAARQGATHDNIYEKAGGAIVEDHVHATAADLARNVR